MPIMLHHTPIIMFNERSYVDILISWPCFLFVFTFIISSSLNAHSWLTICHTYRISCFHNRTCVLAHTSLFPIQHHDLFLLWTQIHLYASSFTFYISPCTQVSLIYIPYHAYSPILVLFMFAFHLCIHHIHLSNSTYKVQKHEHACVNTLTLPITNSFWIHIRLCFIQDFIILESFE